MKLAAKSRSDYNIFSGTAKVSGLAGAVNQICLNVFQAHQSVANFKAEVLEDLKEGNCVGAEFKIGGMVAERYEEDVRNH